jgi:competence protein ComFC
MNPPAIQGALQRSRPVYRFYRWAWSELDLLYPPLCGGCGKPGARWCVECQANARPVPQPLCERCGRSQPDGRLCSWCRASLPAFTALRAWAVFEGPLRQALHRLKYAGDIALGDVLAQPLIQTYQQLAWPVDLAVPVPIGRARRRQRGYNQAALLAWPVALNSGLIYRSRALTKVRDTPSQVGLNPSQRYENVAGAYQAHAALVSGKSVLLVDDVTTSGATMQACSTALLAAGARQVYGLTLARAVHPPDQT